MLADVKILRVIQITIQPILDAVDDSWLKIDQDCPRDVVLIIRLVKEHIFSVVSLSCIVLENAIWVDAMFLAQVFPEFVTDYSERLVLLVLCLL